MASFSAYQIIPCLTGLNKWGTCSHLFGRYTQVPLWTPIKQARVFNPALPILMVLSFSPPWLQVLTALWQCQAVTVDAMCSKGQSFIPHIKQVLIFHSLHKNIKQRSRFVSSTPKAAQDVTGDHVDEGTEGEQERMFLFLVKIQQSKKMDPPTPQRTETENNSISME